jgi:predicted nucleic acid-binding protein
VRLTVVLDSDGLIKLAKAGGLGKLMETWDCLIPRAVYEETVQRGKEAAYSDAEEIDQLVRGHVLEPPSEHPQAEMILAGAESLGRGEREALHLFFVEGADAVISDDRAFLAVLERADLPYLPPALVLVELTRCGGIGIGEAVEVLERMKGLIRPAVYERARENLEALKEEER